VAHFQRVLNNLLNELCIFLFFLVNQFLKVLFLTQIIFWLRHKFQKDEFLKVFIALIWVKKDQ